MENLLMDDILKIALQRIYGYLNQSFSKAEIISISHELKEIVDFDDKDFIGSSIGCSYEDIQSFLASANEKETIRKSNGVYYTSNDVVRFIYANAIKSLYGNLV